MGNIFKAREEVWNWANLDNELIQYKMSSDAAQNLFDQGRFNIHEITSVNGTDDEQRLKDGWQYWLMQHPSDPLQVVGGYDPETQTLNIYANICDVDKIKSNLKTDQEPSWSITEDLGQLAEVKKTFETHWNYAILRENDYGTPAWSARNIPKESAEALMFRLQESLSDDPDHKHKQSYEVTKEYTNVYGP